MKTGNFITLSAYMLTMVVLLILPGNMLSAGGDGIALLREVIRNSAAIGTIDAEITQYIETEGRPREVYRGRYRADRKGRFRIDYSVPSKQIVLNDGRGFYWYYPDDRLLYRMENTAGGVAPPAFNPVKELDTGMKGERFSVRDLGTHLYGFFGTARYLVVTDREKAITIDIVIDPGKKVVLAKTVRGRNGVELMKERYENYREAAGRFFPGRVTVTVRTSRGITRNMTEYNRVELNRAIPPALFRLDISPDVTVKSMH